MKKMKLFAGFLLTLIIALGLSVATFAYSYEVLVSGGSNGTVSDGTTTGEELKTTVSYGGVWTVDDYEVKPDDARYYFKGFHISGQEDKFYVTGDIPIEKDTVFVATYGIKGEMVAYTVNYQNAAGETLYQTQTFYGNVGDTPVVAFRYVENYIPQDLTLTQKLDKDASKNVFTFRYDPAPVNEVIVIDEGGAGGGAGGAGAGGAGAGGAGGGAVVPGGGAGGGGAGGEEIDNNQTPGGAPGGEEETTIDDGKTPQGGPGGETESKTEEPTSKDGGGKNGSVLPWAIGGGAVVVLGAAAGIIAAVKKKKK